MSITPDSTARADDFINDSEANATPANDNGRVPKLEEVAGENAKIHGRFIKHFVERIYTSDDTWSKPDDLIFVEVEIQAAGGNGASSSESGGGGGAGGYSRKLIDEGDLGATEDVEASGGAAFGTHLSATAGSNGSGQSGGAGGTASDGDLNIDGQDGGVGEITSIGGSGYNAPSGEGADSMFGVGGMPSKDVNGNDAVGYGAGGSGGHDDPSSGGSGSPAIVIVREYF